MEDYPKSRQELEDRFKDDQSCFDYLSQIRWPDGFLCPVCGQKDKDAWRTKRGLWHCRACDHQCSVTSGTIFHATRKPLPLWFRAIWDITTQKQGASALNTKRVLGFTSYDTAWTWLQKLRRAMIRPGRDQLGNRVQVDESYLGGKKSGKRGRGAKGKAIIAIAVEDTDPAATDPKKRLGRIRLKHIPDASFKSLGQFISEVVTAGSLIVTDDWSGYIGIEKQGYKREVVDHLEVVLPHIVAGLLKRWILGTHQGAVKPSHLCYYLDEFTFRFNRRKSKSRGLLFYRLLQYAVQIDPITRGNLRSSDPCGPDEDFDDFMPEEPQDVVAT